MYKRGMTLIELLVSLALAGIIFLAIFHVSSLAGKQIHIYIERYNAYNQLGYALDDMALRLPSASLIRTPFSESGKLEVLKEMQFVGAHDVYNVTPFEGDTEYRYGIDTASGALVLDDLTNNKTEILVEAKYQPDIQFVRHGDEKNIEPDFMTVIVSANCTKSASIGLPTKVVKAEGVTFWFVDVVEPK